MPVMGFLGIFYLCYWFYICRGNDRFEASFGWSFSSFLFSARWGLNFDLIDVINRLPFWKFFFFLRKKQFFLMVINYEYVVYRYIYRGNDCYCSQWMLLILLEKEKSSGCSFVLKNYQEWNFFNKGYFLNFISGSQDTSWCTVYNFFSLCTV